MRFLLPLITFLGVCHSQDGFSDFNEVFKRTAEAVNSLGLNPGAPVPDGVQIPFPFPVYGYTTADTNTTMIPLNVLCQTTGILGVLACHTCHIDCIYVHNAYGGQCGMDPTPINGVQSSGPVCICNTQPYPDGILPTAAQHCGPFVDAETDAHIDPAIHASLMARNFVALCQQGIDNGGCNVAATKGHQYNSGICSTTYSVPKYPGDVPVRGKYCVPLI